MRMPAGKTRKTVFDIDGTIVDNISAELSSRLRTDTPGARLFSEFVYNVMHLTPHHSSRVILRKPEFDDRIVNMLRSAGDGAEVRTRNNFRDLEQIRDALGDIGIEPLITRVKGSDKLLKEDGSVTLIEDTPLNALISVAKHKGANAIIVPRPYNLILGRLAAAISRRIRMLD